MPDNIIQLLRHFFHCQIFYLLQVFHRNRLEKNRNGGYKIGILWNILYGKLVILLSLLLRFLSSSVCSLTRLLFTNASNSSLLSNENFAIFRKTSVRFSITSSTSIRWEELHLGCFVPVIAVFFIERSAFRCSSALLF